MDANAKTLYVVYGGTKKNTGGGEGGQGGDSGQENYVHKFTLNFNANGGTGTMDNQVFTYDKEQVLTSNAFEKTDCKFLGWATEEDSDVVVYADGASVSNLTTENGGKVNLYAVWELKENPNVGTDPEAEVDPDMGIDQEVDPNVGTDTDVDVDPEMQVKPEAPETGDASNVGVMVLIMLLSVAGVSVMLINRRRYTM